MRAPFRRALCKRQNTSKTSLETLWNAERMAQFGQAPSQLYRQGLQRLCGSILPNAVSTLLECSHLGIGRLIGRSLLHTTGRSPIPPGAPAPMDPNTGVLTINVLTTSRLLDGTVSQRLKNSRGEIAHALHIQGRRVNVISAVSPIKQPRATRRLCSRRCCESSPGAAKNWC